MMNIYGINYPGSINSNHKKIDYLYRMKQLLIDEFNAEGAKFRDGKISKADWKIYTRDWEDKHTCVLGDIITIRGEFKNNKTLGAELSHLYIAEVVDK